MKRFFSSFPSPIKRGNGLNYRLNQQQTGNPRKKLVVMIGWLGAKDSQMKSYLSFYHQHGFDTLSFAVGPKHILSPNNAMKHMEDVWNVTKEITEEKGLDGHQHGDVVVHAFSMGGYLFGQSLRTFERNPEKYDSLKKQIKVQIFDSPPDHGSIANGISKSFPKVPKVLEKPIELCVQSYLTLTANTSGVEHRAASQSFHNNFIRSPSLWYYSKSDVVAKYTDCERVIERWKGNGIPVDVCSWEHTAHIQHARQDPDRYFGVLKDFLIRNEMIESDVSEVLVRRKKDIELESESESELKQHMNS